MTNYNFSDEIQNAKDSARLAAGLYLKDNVDIYLTTKKIEDTFPINNFLEF